MNLNHSLAEVQRLLHDGTITTSSLVDSSLSEIKRLGQLNAVVETFANAPLEAQKVDKKIAEGSQGKLAGLLVSVKDLISVKGQEINGASKILKGYQATFSSTAIARLLSEDAILIGRANCDEFGMGSTNESSVFGPALNPIDPTRVPGGSSGGSAASVKAGMCMASLGTDTGGSVRQPASFCDVIGFKPTYGRISRNGMLAYASSFDCMGIIGNNISDIQIIYEVIAGHDKKDATSSTRPVTTPVKNGKKRIIVFSETIDHPQLHPDIKTATVKTLEEFEKNGHEVIYKNFSKLDYVLPTYYILASAEASSNLSRYDGVKFGKRADDYQDLQSMYMNTRSEGFGEEVQRRIILGTFVLSASYHDAFFTQAQKVRQLIKDEINAHFDDGDFIALPTSPTPPFKLGEITKDPLQMYLADLYTVIASVSGNPAISIPNGYDQSGLPIGFQLIGQNFNESNLLAFADYALNLSGEGVKERGL